MVSAIHATVRARVLLNMIIFLCKHLAFLARDSAGTAADPMTCLFNFVRSVQQQRQEFWDTQPAYGGAKDIWDALKAVCEAPDMETGKVFLEAAEVSVAKPDMTAFYDSRGYLYELPNYVVSDPKDWK